MKNSETAAGNMDLAAAIALLDSAVKNPTEGLPDDIFYFISRTTPLVNVDLLIKNDRGQTLLSWRDDQYAGTGWHVPGGIIRYKETLETRIEKVALAEIGIPVVFDPVPVALNELIHHENINRGHFISLLYDCRVRGDFQPANDGLQDTDPGYLAWHDSCPDNLIRYHEIYRTRI